MGACCCCCRGGHADSDSSVELKEVGSSSSSSGAGGDNGPGMPPIVVDRHAMEVTLGRDNMVRGRGVAACNVGIEQDCCYWEVKIVKMGNGVGIGVTKSLPKAKDESNPTFAGDAQTSFGIALAEAAEALQDGDIVGVVMNLGGLPMLSFFRNGEEMPEFSVKRVTGRLYPAVCVDGGTVQMIFDERQLVHINDVRVMHKVQPLIAATNMI